jgi:hypothetical protein
MEKFHNHPTQDTLWELNFLQLIVPQNKNAVSNNVPIPMPICINCNGYSGQQYFCEEYSAQPKKEFVPDSLHMVAPNTNGKVRSIMFLPVLVEQCKN